MATLKRGNVKNSGTSKDRAVKGYSVECATRGESRDRGLMESNWKFLVKAASKTIGAEQLLLVTTVNRPSESGYQGAKMKSISRTPRHAKNNLSREVFSVVGHPARLVMETKKNKYRNHMIKLQNH